MGKFCLLSLGEFEGDVGQKGNNQSKGKSDLDISGEVQKILAAHSSIPSNLTLINKVKIAKIRSVVKTASASESARLEKFGVINAAANHAAETLTDKLDNALNQGRGSNLIKVSRHLQKAIEHLR